MNGMPHYVSIMNYMFLDSGFSLGTNTRVLVPSALDESAGIGGSADYLEADSRWKYKIWPSGAVDWNRNGVPDTGLVRAPIHQSYSGFPSAFNVAVRDYYGDNQTPNAKRMSAPSVARYKSGSVNKVYVFYSVGNSNDNLPFRYSVSDVKADGSCLGHTQGQQFALSCPATKYVGSVNAKEVAATSRGPKMYLAVSDNNRFVSIISADVNGSTGELINPTIEVTVFGDIVGAPDIATDGTNMKVVWRDANANLQVMRKSGNNNWIGPYVVGIQSFVSPTIVYNPFALPSGGIAHLATTDANNNIKLYRSNGGFSSANFVADTTYIAQEDGNTIKTNGRIGIGVISPSQGLDWNIILAYSKFSGIRPTVAYFLKFDDPNNPKTGALAGYDDFVPGGVDYEYFPGDLNVHGVMTDTTQSGQRVLYLPFADGIHMFTAQDSNDMQYMSTRVCSKLSSAPCNGGFNTAIQTYDPTDVYDCGGFGQ